MAARVPLEDSAPGSNPGPPVQRTRRGPIAGRAGHAERGAQLGVDERIGEQRVGVARRREHPLVAEQADLGAERAGVLERRRRSRPRAARRGSRAGRAAARAGRRGTSRPRASSRRSGRSRRPGRRAPRQRAPDRAAGRWCPRSAAGRARPRPAAAGRSAAATAVTPAREQRRHRGDLRLGRGRERRADRRRPRRGAGDQQRLQRRPPPGVEPSGEARQHPSAPGARAITSAAGAAHSSWKRYTTPAGAGAAPSIAAARSERSRAKASVLAAISSSSRSIGVGLGLHAVGVVGRVADERERQLGLAGEHRLRPGRLRDRGHAGGGEAADLRLRVEARAVDVPVAAAVAHRQARAARPPRAARARSGGAYGSSKIQWPRRGSPGSA